jgi:chromosome segregation ATPase
MMTNSSKRGAAADRVARAAAAIERAASGASEQIAVLQAQITARDAELERLRDVCNDRQRVIDELSGHVSTYRRAAEERAVLVASLDFELGRVREDLLDAERARNDAVAKAEGAVHAVDEERQRTRLTSGVRDAELRESQRVTASMRSRITMFEDALTARAAVIDELQTACEERLATIEQLSDELAAIRLIAEERLLVLETNEARYRAREALRESAGEPDDGVDWRGIAQERERALGEVAAEAERRSVLLAEVTAALEGRTREAEELRKRLTKAS